MTQPHIYDPETLRQMMAQADAVDAAIAESVREALRMHKLLGNPVVTWEEGRVVLIPADQIPVDEMPAHEMPVDTSAELQ